MHKTCQLKFKIIVHNKYNKLQKNLLGAESSG